MRKMKDDYESRLGNMDSTNLSRFKQLQEDYINQMKELEARLREEMERLKKIQQKALEKQWKTLE